MSCRKCALWVIVALATTMTLSGCQTVAKEKAKGKVVSAAQSKAGVSDARPGPGASGPAVPSEKGPKSLDDR
jgi:outer membrane protein assembly factor BamE (lipoprotein component of BamABCDE complex)